MALHPYEKIRSAVWRGRLTEIQRLLGVEHRPQEKVIEDIDNLSLLCGAAKGGHLKCVQWMLKAGASPHATDEGDTPLMGVVGRSAKEDDEAIIELLLQVGTDIHKKSVVTGLQVLSKAACAFNLQALQRLSQLDFSVEERSDALRELVRVTLYCYGTSETNDTSYENVTKLVELLLKTGADPRYRKINKPRRDGRQPKLPWNPSALDRLQSRIDIVGGEIEVKYLKSIRDFIANWKAEEQRDDISSVTKPGKSKAAEIGGKPAWVGKGVL